MVLLSIQGLNVIVIIADILIYLIGRRTSMVTQIQHTLYIFFAGLVNADIQFYQHGFNSDKIKTMDFCRITLSTGIYSCPGQMICAGQLITRGQIFFPTG